MKNIIILPLLSLFLVFSCTQENEVQQQTQQLIKTSSRQIELSGIWGIFANGEPVFSEEKAALIIAANKMTKNRLFKHKLKSVFFNDLEFSKFGQKHFLIGEAVLQNNEFKTEQIVTFAFEIENDGNNNVILGKVSHSCTGDPCTQCEFGYDDNGHAGCSCNDSGSTSRCNHTVTVEDDSPN